MAAIEGGKLPGSNRCYDENGDSRPCNHKTQRRSEEFVDVAQIRDARHGFAHEVLVRHRRGVGGNGPVAGDVGDALRAERTGFGIDLIHLMGHQRARGQAERDGVAHFDVKRIDRFDVHQRANGIFGLHAARENGVRGQSYEAHARKRNQKHRRCCN